MIQATDEQQQTNLLQQGWTQWTEELADGKKIRLDFWADPVGEAKPYRNESNQWEYGNSQRRYTFKQALRIQKLRDDTEIFLAARRAEAEKHNPARSKPVSAAEAAALASAEA